MHVEYAPRRIPAGLALMGVAGLMSGLLGIGSGALKALAMDLVMRLPFKVSTATSNFMISITAGASAAIYFRQGFIDPVLADLGTLVLVAAPALQLVLAVGIFARRRDALYAGFSLLVLALLLGGLAWGWL